MVPMRDPSYEVWKKFETFEKRLVKKYKTIHVISGATYQEKTEKREGKMGIPEFFYKIYFSPNTSKMLGLVVPNTNFKKAKSLYSYTTPVVDIERLTGNKYFPKIKESLSKRVKKKIPNF